MAPPPAFAGAGSALDGLGPGGAGFFPERIDGMADKQTFPYGPFNDAVLGLMDSVYNAVTRDKTVFAFLRQGVNELAAAFGTMSGEHTVTEPGAVFHPLHSDIAASRENGLGAEQASPAASLLSPSQIAQETVSTGSVHGEQRAVDKPLPSPSEIAREDLPYSPPEQGQGQEHGREM
jgi:hypothetical protein